MALQSTGSISFADVQNEFGGSNPISLTEYYGQSTLPASGKISLSDFYGTSSIYEISISSNQTTLDLRSYAVTNGWDESSSLKVTIGSGVYIDSNSTSTAALTVSGSFPSGVEIINNGFIVGMGGNGGAGGNRQNGFPGLDAGTALSVSSSVSVDNQGTIAGGGGGGGGGGGLNTSRFKSTSYWTGGGGGGGRTGLTNSSPGTSGGTAATAGTSTSAGLGGTGDNSAGSGGNGGNWGASGNTGSSSTYAGGSGGGGGEAIVGDSNITWINTGTRFGAIL